MEKVPLTDRLPEIISEENISDGWEDPSIQQFRVGHPRSGKNLLAERIARMF